MSLRRAASVQNKFFFPYSVPLTMEVYWGLTKHQFTTPQLDPLWHNKKVSLYHYKE